MAQKLQKLFATFDTALEQMGRETVATVSGKIVWAKDNILFVEGISGIRMGEVVTILETQVPALVMQVERGNCYAVILRPSQEVKPGQTVVPTGQILSVPAGPKVLGRVIDPLGDPLDDRGSVESEKFMPLDAQAPGVFDREPVGTPLQTGIVAIDGLVPIGRGQRELIIGDRQTGKTTVAVDAIISQKGQDVICVYVAIGQRDGNTAQVIKTLQKHGAMDYTTVVVASASQPAVLQYLAPYAGQAIAEWFMYQGKHALVVFDDLSKQAVAYREISLLLRRPPGREAYPGDIFYLHSRLLERSAQLSQERGGGSITALPIVETLGGDVSAYIPTNVISITDGQIFLESSLFYRGIRPAINVGISVSRVGGAAQTKIMKKVAGTAKLQLAQYYELAAFSQFASELDAESKKRLVRGERLVEALKQGAQRPYRLWQEVVALKAAMDGHFDSLEVQLAAPAVQQLIDFISVSHPELPKAIETKKELTPEIDEMIAKALKAFTEKLSNT